MAERHFDVVVIGGGPGGYVAAIRAAQLGYKTAIIERDKLGGVCLNWGCVPSKALLSNAELIEKLHEKEAWGLKLTGEVGIDWDKTIGRSREVAAKLNKGVEFLMRKNKIEFIKGNAKILSGRKSWTAAQGDVVKIAVQDCTVQDTLTSAPATPGNTRETITCTHCVIATGSVARDLPFAKFDGDKIWGAREAMFNKTQPKSLIVVGAGAIGMEFGYFYHTLGTKVTVVEMMPRIVPVEDDDVCTTLEKVYKKHGMEIRTNTGVVNIEKTGAGVKVTVAPMVKGADGKMAPDQAKKETLEADKVLLAIGVKGRYDGLFDASLNLTIERDHIKTDYNAAKKEEQKIDYKTNVPGLYAIGDVIGPPWLAHVSSEEAMACVERIGWRDKKLNHEPHPVHYGIIPGCTYCHPQIASVGYTERELKEQGKVKGKDYDVGTFPFSALAKAIATRNTDGFVKIIKGVPRGEILGAHIIGDQATELIAELSLAKRVEATTEEIIATMHAHPTMHESVRESALASEGRVVNA